MRGEENGGYNADVKSDYVVDDGEEEEDDNSHASVHI
jgi:hypothetical protein